MRRRTTGTVPAPEPIGEGDTTMSDAAPSLAPPLADGSNTYDLESLARDADVADPTDEFDAILLVEFRDRDHADAPTGAKAELVLYIVDDSASCTEAKRQLDRILNEYVEVDLRLTIRNLSQVPLDPMETRVLAVPTLIVRRGRRDGLGMPGDTTEATLLDILASCGARRVDRR